jgi:hypothetical protein
MYDGELRRMSYSAALDTVRHAAAKVGIRKHVHPHLFRHSRATELRLIGVSDDSIRLRLGWVRGSNMIARYVSLADDQADDEVAAKLGLKVEKRPASVRKLELGAEIPALGDEVDALKARIAEMERDREKLAIEAVRVEVRKMAESFRAMLKDGGFDVSPGADWVRAEGDERGWDQDPAGATDKKAVRDRVLGARARKTKNVFGVQVSKKT